MSTSRLYRTLSILIVLTLLFNATSLLTATPITAAPLKSEAQARQAQSADFHIHGSVRNRDGASLGNVVIFLSAYNGSSVNPSSVITATQKVTANDGIYDWTFPGAAFTTTATIQITHTASAGYTFVHSEGLPLNGSHCLL